MASSRQGVGRQRVGCRLPLQAQRSKACKSSQALTIIVLRLLPAGGAALQDGRGRQLEQARQPLCQVRARLRLYAALARSPTAAPAAPAMPRWPARPARRAHMLPPRPAILLWLTPPAPPTLPPSSVALHGVTHLPAPAALPAPLQHLGFPPERQGGCGCGHAGHRPPAAAAVGRQRQCALHAPQRPLPALPLPLRGPLRQWRCRVSRVQAGPGSGQSRQRAASWRRQPALRGSAMVDGAAPGRPAEAGAAVQLQPAAAAAAAASLQCSLAARVCLAG